MYNDIKRLLNAKLLMALGMFFVGRQLVAQQPTGLDAIRERLLARQRLSPTTQSVSAPTVQSTKPIMQSLNQLSNNPVSSAIRTQPGRTMTGSNIPPVAQQPTGLDAIRERLLAREEASPTVQSIKPVMEPSITSTPTVLPISPTTTSHPVTQSFVSQEDSDEYVQTEAHLQIYEVQRKMDDFIMRVPEDKNRPKHPRTPNEMVAPYLNIVSAVINKEVEFKDSHYVFYQASNNTWRVPQDLYKQLFAYYNPLTSVKDFVFVRFSDVPSMNAHDFLVENIQKFAGINDNIGAVRDLLLSVNLSLFGNVGFPGECTWNYFIEAKSHRRPYPNNYQEILDAFGLTYNLESFTKEANELEIMLDKASEEQTLLQFCVPQDMADDIAYVAWVIGFPAHPKSMEILEQMLKGKPRVGKFTGPAVKKLIKQFSKEREKDPVYRDLVTKVENGEFGIKAFMDVYRNQPWDVKNANEIQGRLFVTKEGLKDPKSGIKIFPYFVTSKDIQETYLNRIAALIKKMIDQEQTKTEDQKIADRTENARLLKELIAQREKEDAKD